MIKIKNFFFLTLFLALTVLIWGVSDFVISNTFIKKQENCYIFEEKFYKLKENCKGKFRFKTSFPATNIFTDEFGFRTMDSAEKEFKEKKIFLLGDSFTFGVGLEYEDTFSGLLEINQSDYRFFNFAVPSYSPTVYSYKLKKILEKKIIPDKVILFLDITDIHDEAGRWTFNRNINKPELITNEVFNKNKKDNFKHRNFKITTQLASILNLNLRILRSELRNIFQEKTETNLTMNTFQGQFIFKNEKDLDSNFWSEGMINKGSNNIVKNIDTISKILKKNNSDFYLVIYPWAETLVYGQDFFNWSEFGKKLCSNEKCKFIDTLQVFEQYKINNKNWMTDLYFPNDIHFTKLGSEIIFNELISKIEFN